YGCGIGYSIAAAPKDKHFSITLNVITPYVPITSDGKAPNLEIFLDDSERAAGSAVRKAHIPGAKGTGIKGVVLGNLAGPMDSVSNNGQYRFNQRQILYALRPIVMTELEKVFTTEHMRRHGQPVIITRTASGKLHLLYRYNGEGRRIRPFPDLPIDILGDNG